MNTHARLVPLLLVPLALTGCPGPSGSASAELTGGAPNPGVGAVTSTDRPAPSAGVTPSGSSAKASGVFQVLGTTPTGRTLFVSLPAARTVESAILLTADELAKVLDAKPTLAGAFADSKSKRRGGALLTGKLEGRDVRGWIFCGVESTIAGASASVILAPADASGQDLATLFAFMPGRVAMQTHAFPDGSATVDLPEGWTTPQQSASFGVTLVGPAGQSIGIGNSILVNTPDGRMAQMPQKTYAMQLSNYKMQMQMYRQALARHQQFPNTLAPIEPKAPTPPDLERDMPGLIFCRVCSGAQEVLDFLYPIGERRAKKAGGRYTRLEKVIEVVPADSNPGIPGSKAGVAYIEVSDHDGDKVTRMRVLNRIETYPVLDGKDTWVVTYNNLRAPDETFDRDLPVMNDIMASYTLNMQVVTAQIQQAGAAARQAQEESGRRLRQMADDSQRQLLKRGRDFNEQQASHFKKFESQMAAQSQARHDSSSDFIEYISGVRHVADTRTGERGSVDLFNSTAIVDRMNAGANEPGRFVEIPLRNER